MLLMAANKNRNPSRALAGIPMIQGCSVQWPGKHPVLLDRGITERTGGLILRWSQMAQSLTFDVAEKHEGCEHPLSDECHSLHSDETVQYFLAFVIYCIQPHD